MDGGLTQFPKVNCYLPKTGASHSVLIDINSETGKKLRSPLDLRVEPLALFSKV